MRRATLAMLAAGAALALSAQAADASVLISAPAPFTKPCGARIEVGVWLRDDGRPADPDVTISVRTRSGRVLWRKHVRAKSVWRYWHYKPQCGRRYVVRYRNRDFGVDDFKVRVRGGG